MCKHAVKQFTNWVTDDLLGIDPGGDDLAAERARAAQEAANAQMALDQALANSRAALENAQRSAQLPADSEAAQRTRESRLRRALAATRRRVDRGALGAAQTGAKLLFGS